MRRLGLLASVVLLGSCATSDVQRAECYMHQWAVIEASDEVDDDDLRSLPDADLRWEAEQEQCARDGYLLELEAEPPWWVRGDPAEAEGMLYLCSVNVPDGQADVLGQLTLHNAWASRITVESAAFSGEHTQDLELEGVEQTLPADLDARESLHTLVVRGSIGVLAPPPTGRLDLTLRHSLTGETQQLWWNFEPHSSCQGD